MDAKGAQALVKRLALERQRRAELDQAARELSSGGPPAAAAAPEAPMPSPAATRRSRRLPWWPRRGG